MRGFLLDSNGDIVVNGSDIAMVEGEELLAQKVRSVLSTNKGEWFADEEEGIDNRVIVGKKQLNEDEVKYEILKGLLQVDSSFFITSFEMEIDKKKRQAKIYFTAETNSGEKISEVITYA